MKKICLLLITIPVFIYNSFAQTDKQLKATATETNKQKTANSKDILTTLFRAGVDNLLGEKHSFTLNSSFYGIDSIFRKKGTTISYDKERKLRQTSFNISLTGDSNNSITKLSGGFTFTLINEKDIKLKKLDQVDRDALVSMSVSVSYLKKGINNYIAQKYITIQDSLKRITSSSRHEKIEDSIRNIIDNAIDRSVNSLNSAAKKNDYSGLDELVIEALNDPNLLASISNSISKDSELRDPATNQIIPKSAINSNIPNIINGTKDGKDPFHELYKNIAEKYARKPLWTFSPTATYDRINKQGEYSFATEFTVGLNKDPSKKPWELELKSSFTISNDTSIKKTNYENKPFLISAGLNKVLIQNEEKESKMEFKFFTQYDYQFGNVPTGKEAGVFTLNSTLRINVFKSLWLPITLKYDPDNSNFLGYFSITANIGN